MNTPPDRSRDDDEDSLLEKCWEEQYRNDSKKWLIRDASYKHVKEPPSTTMKTSYQFPDVKTPYDILSRRRALLLRQFEIEATEEILRESNQPLTIEEYCTEYGKTYYLPGFAPDDEFYTKSTELYEKYPLYTSTPMTYYAYNVKNKFSPLPAGATKVINQQAPFRKNSKFTTPITESFDTGL